MGVLRTRHLLLGAGALLVGAGIGYGLTPRSLEISPLPVAPAAPAAAATDRAPAPVACAADLGCTAQALRAAAAPACSAAIEQLAAFGVRWTGDPTPVGRFPRQRWLDAGAGRVTLLGDAVEFRNGSDAYAAVDYECDVGPVAGGAVEVRARPRPLRN